MARMQEDEHSSSVPTVRHTLSCAHQASKVVGQKTSDRFRFRVGKRVMKLKVNKMEETGSGSIFKQIYGGHIAQRTKHNGYRL